MARDILAAFGRPVVAPSANRSGHVSPTTRRSTSRPISRGRIDLIVDGGATPVGVESTIVACLGEPDAAAAGRHAARGDRARRSAAAGAARRAAAADERSAARARHAGLALCAAQRGCGSMPTRVDAGEALLAFGASRRRRRARDVDAQSVAARRSHRGGRQSVLASARARCRRRRRASP